MRIIWISALALIMGLPALADDEHHDWKYRSHRERRPEINRENDGYERRDWDHERRDWDRPRFEHRRHERPWYPEREAMVVYPEPPVIHVRPLPIPPPPPVGIHLWFGF